MAKKGFGYNILLPLSTPPIYQRTSPCATLYYKAYIWSTSLNDLQVYSIRILLAR